jgi:hypothetical protein
MDRPLPRSAGVESGSTVCDPSQGVIGKPNERLELKDGGQRVCRAAATPAQGQCARLRSISHSRMAARRRTARLALITTGW